VRDMFGGDLLRPGTCLFPDRPGDEGWELLLGATLESAYASSVPADSAMWARPLTLRTALTCLRAPW